MFQDRQRRQADAEHIQEHQDHHYIEQPLEQFGDNFLGTGIQARPTADGFFPKPIRFLAEPKQYGNNSKKTNVKQHIRQFIIYK